MILRQAEIARETGLSQMTISRRLRALDRVKTSASDFDAIAMFASIELEKAGVPGHRAIEFLAAFASELRWLIALPSRRCWVVLAETERAKFCAPAHTDTHLHALMNAFPLSRVVP